MSGTEEPYDPVIDALIERRDHLWQMTQRNMQSLGFGIMDQIRLKHIDMLEDAIKVWQKHKPNYDE